MSKSSDNREADDIGRIDAITAQVLLRELLGSAKVAALVLAPDLVPVWCNGACEALLGEARSVLLARDMRDTWDDTLRRTFRVPESFVGEVLDSYARGTHLAGFEGRVQTEHGERRVRYSSLPIPAGSHAGGRIEVFADVTADDSSHQERKMEAISRLAGSVAHDFNNVLTAVNGYGQLLSQMIPEDSPQRAFVDEICTAGERGAEMTAHLMRISPRLPIRPKVLELDRLVQDLRNTLQERIGEVRLETACAPGPGCVEADRGQMEQVLLHLATNARDAMPSGGRLLIEVSNVDFADRFLGVPPGPYVCVAATDTGSGIEPDVLEHIFEPKFTTKKTSKATGFGLATVYATVIRSHGHVHVDSEVGRGTTFRIYLPRVEPPEARVR